MVQSDAELTVAQRLGQLLDRGLLPAGGPAEAAERLIERLERPARVALLGLPGSGKSAILNLLTGTALVPETLRLPTIIVQHGEVPRMLCTLTDGRTEVVPGSDLNDVLSLNPALVTLEMDLPALKVISLLEVSAGPQEAEQSRAAIWASKRADILIWCTTSYLPKEQQVWEGMPDVVKDNGFLFLTKVDLLGSAEAAAGVFERVEMRAGEEFRQVLAISAKQARAAMAPGAPVDRELFRESGASAVITAIKSRVQAARRADTDMAELLLARHVEAGGFVARRFGDSDDKVAAAAPAAPTWAPPPEAPVEPRTVQTPAAAEVAPPEILPATEPEPEQTPEQLTEFQPGLDPEPEEPPPESEPVAEPAQILATEPEPDLATGPAFKGMPAPDATFVDGRRRFSDRIRQMPVPADTPAVPLRSTWKSKAETTAARTAAPEPIPEPEAVPDSPRSERRRNDDSRPPRSDIPARPAAANESESREDDATPTRLMGPVSDAEPEPKPDDIALEVAQEDSVADDRVADDLEDVESAEEASVEDTSPRWAERLKPAGAEAPIERSARTSLFGARKPAAAAPQAAEARPSDRVARLTEPVTRVRAPAPRPAEPPRPVSTSPDVLATPRIVAMRDRPHAGLDAADPQRVERRERTRIAARPVLSAPVAAVEPPVSIPAAEKDLLDSAIRQIEARSAELAALIDPDEKIPVDMILDHSRETIEQVIAVLGPARSDGLRRIVGDLGEIQDIVMLMQLEKGHAPADDALTLLLQIRRDLETLYAA
jgi:hypothetical protein